MNWAKFKNKWEKATSDEKESLYVSKLISPAGTLVLACTDKGVVMVEFLKLDRLEASLKDIQKRRPLKVEFKKNIMLKKLESELEVYFKKKLKKFTTPLDPVGTEFQKKVWDVLYKIPYGETMSYSDQAKAYGNIKALRAVASANGKNKISIVLPCHRVIGKSGDLTGYAGGLDKKSWLLEHEGII